VEDDEHEAALGKLIEKVFAGTHVNCVGAQLPADERISQGRQVMRGLDHEAQLVGPIMRNGITKAAHEPRTLEVFALARPVVIDFAAVRPLPRVDAPNLDEMLARRVRRLADRVHTQHHATGAALTATFVAD